MVSEFYLYLLIFLGLNELSCVCVYFNDIIIDTKPEIQKLKKKASGFLFLLVSTLKIFEYPDDYTFMQNYSEKYFWQNSRLKIKWINFYGIDTRSYVCPLKK